MHSQTKSIRFRAISLLSLLSLALGGCDASSAKKTIPAKPEGVNGSRETSSPDYAETLNLFDGESLDGWKVLNYGGTEKVAVTNGQIVMEPGVPYCGVGLDVSRPLPGANYEFSVDAKRLRGSDYFCALTFPVEKTYCTLIIGGWGGQTIGLSNLDGRKGSENETTRQMNFENDHWYRIRVRVDDSSVTAWIDDEEVIHQPREGHKFASPGDFILSKPFGINAYRTRAAFRNIQLKHS